MKRRRCSSSSKATSFSSQENVSGVTIPPPADCGSSSSSYHSIGNNAEQDDCSSVVMKIISLTCGSGFVKLDELQLVSLSLCNECREANVSWRLRVDDRTPQRLMRLIQGPDAHSTPLERIHLPLRIHHIRQVIYGMVRNAIFS